jgi:glycosyltransferase involved in cell wall biosynthesis
MKYGSRDSFDVTVVMPTYNRVDVLKESLRGYEAQDFHPGRFEVVVIDDGSTDSTPDFLRDYRPRHYSMRAIRQEKGQGGGGPAAARNRGIDEAQGRLVLFTGDDIIPTSNLVRGHWETHSSSPYLENTAILGKVVWHPQLPISTVMTHICGPGGEQFSFAGFVNGATVDFRHFYTCNLAVPAAVFHRGFRFSTKFTNAAFEDTELGYRLERDLGLQIRYHDNLVGFHKHYHSARTFARRQFAAGRMGCLFAEMHPEASWCTGLADLRSILSLPRWTSFDDGNCLSEWEESLLGLLSRFDMEYVPRLERLHHAVFKYFYMKGLMEGHWQSCNARRHMIFLLRATVGWALERFARRNRCLLSPAECQSLVPALRANRFAKMYQRAKKWLHGCF